MSFCPCSCHTNPEIKHCVPCCNICPYCLGNVPYALYTQHLMDCPSGIQSEKPEKELTKQLCLEALKTLGGSGEKLVTEKEYKILRQLIEERFERRDMKIERDYIPRMTIQDFAEKHDLTMVIKERSLPALSGYYACFKHAEIKRGNILEGAFGNGDTEEAAIAKYATEISGKLLVIDAYGKDRREIQVPLLT